MDVSDPLENKASNLTTTSERLLLNSDAILVHSPGKNNHHLTVDNNQTVTNTSDIILNNSKESDNDASFVDENEAVELINRKTQASLSVSSLQNKNDDEEANSLKQKLFSTTIITPGLSNKAEEKKAENVNKTITNNLNNNSANVQVPHLTVCTGPPPPKRNFAVKQTACASSTNSSSLNNQNNGQTTTTTTTTTTLRVSSRSASRLTYKNYCEESDSNDEYILYFLEFVFKLLKSYDKPSKNARDFTDCSEIDDEEGISRTKSVRLVKKPKLLDVVHANTDSSFASSASNILTKTQSNTTSLVRSFKATARKSTTGVLAINQNQLNVQQRLSTSTSTPTNNPANKPQITPISAQKASVLPNGNSNSSLAAIQKQLSASSPSQNASNLNISPPVVQQTQYKNKMISCKPFYLSKSIECRPMCRDASTQIDLDEIKLAHTVVPVPVPINVPIPMCMYQAPLPVPLIIPVPIAVPVFIPTTKKTFDRVERKIKKLREKLPSDPYEFELLLYAEKLARDDGIAGFEDSSDGESSSSDTDEYLNHASSSSSSKADIFLNHKQTTFLLNNNSNNNNQNEEPQMGYFKWNLGIKAFNTWLNRRLESARTKRVHFLPPSRQPNDLIKLKNDELNASLAEFVNDVRKPNGEIYAPESIFYICLGIQYYLQEKGARSENIFLSSGLFDEFQEQFNKIALRYNIRIDAEGQIISKIEEEILWESKQLGAHSPLVLLHTILYFNTKYFFLDKVESHKKLSFSNVKKHAKRNIGPNGEDFGRTCFLRYYPDYNGMEQVIYEQGENFDNPLRCPVELYNFYLSKCPENVKNRSDVFYLLPEKASMPASPVWFSSQPLSDKQLERMLNRIKMVKEVNELLLAAAPATTSVIIQ